MVKFRFFFLLAGVFVLLAGVGGATAVPVADGDLDITFSSDGIATTSFAPTDETGYAMTLDNSGRVVMVGSDFKVARLTASGNLDPTFNGAQAGLAIADMDGGGGNAHAVAVQASGRIVVAGIINASDFFLYGFEADGTRDWSFGLNGRTTTDFGGTETLRAIGLQSDGKIIAIGTTDSQGDDLDFAIARYTADGILDTTFGGGDGKIITDFAGEDAAYSLAVRDDDKFVVAGTYAPIGQGGSQNDVAVARYNANGSLDTGFSGDGKVTTDLGGNDFVRDVLSVSGSARVVVAGYENGGSDAFLVRYNSDGTLDSNFDGDGIAQLDWGNVDQAYSVLVQPDAKLLVAGQVWQSGQTDFLVARYEVDGSPDTSFGDGSGKRRVNMGMFTTDDIAYDMVLQNDNRIVVGGVSDPNADADFALMRFTSDGDLDSAYHLDGKRTIDFGRSAQGMAVAVQTDGKIVAAGQGKTFYIPGNGDTLYTYPLLARYSATGSPDGTFGTAGMLIDESLFIDTVIENVHLKANGDILTTGYSYSVQNYVTLFQYNDDGTPDTAFGTDGVMLDYYDLDIELATYDSVVLDNGQIILTGYWVPNFGTPDMAVFRYNSDGSRDMTFGTDGVAVVDLGGWEYGRSVAVQSNGKIVVAGYTDANFEQDMAVLRFNSDGTLDNTFSGDGIAYGDFVGDQDFAFGVEVLDSGKIVVGGYSDLDFAVVRYNSNGTLDTTFGTNGRTTTHIAGSDYVNDMFVQNDGRIVLAGCTVPASGNRDFALARYNADGSLDTSFSGDGTVTTDLGGQDIAQSVVQQPDGNLVAVGYTDIWGNNDFALVRYEGTPCSDCDYVLTVNLTGSGGGTVTSMPAGINCGSDCTESYDHGTEVVLTAVANSGSTFTDWSGACAGSNSHCTINMTDAQTVIANFDTIPEGFYGLTVDLEGEGGGTVTSSTANRNMLGSGNIDCNPTPNAMCTAVYPEGTQVTLQAIPDAGSVFAGWSGNCTGAGECVVTMEGEIVVTATFVEGYLIHLPFILSQ